MIDGRNMDHRVYSLALLTYDVHLCKPASSAWSFSLPGLQRQILKKTREPLFSFDVFGNSYIVPVLLTHTYSVLVLSTNSG